MYRNSSGREQLSEAIQQMARGNVDPLNLPKEIWTVKLRTHELLHCTDPTFIYYTLTSIWLGLTYDVFETKKDAMEYIKSLGKGKGK